MNYWRFGTFPGKIFKKIYFFIFIKFGYILPSPREYLCMYMSRYKNIFSLCKEYFFRLVVTRK